MKAALPHKDIRKVLVRGVNWIGDTVITLPSIKGIRAVFPDAYIAVLLQPHLSSLFGRCTFVDELIPYPHARGLNLFLEESALVKSIRQKQFDLAVILPRSFRSALIPYLAQIPYRIGYTTCQRGMLLTHRLDEKEEVLNCHQVEYYYHMVQSLGGAQPYELPNLFLGREEKKWAHRFLRDAEIDEGALLIGINPGSTYGIAKCWCVERYLELARRLIKRTNATIILVGGKDNTTLIDHIASNLNGHIIKAVGEELLHLAALMEKCQLLITNDTGPMHIAAAVRTPVVALFGSTNHVTTSPLGSGHRIIRKGVSCSPCLNRVCPEDHRCMNLISVDEVEKVVMEKLDLPIIEGEEVLRRSR